MTTRRTLLAAAFSASLAQAQPSGKKLRIGIVGGRFGATFYFHEHPDCIVEAVADLRPELGKAGENSTIWDSPSPKFIMGGSGEEKFDHPTQKPVDLMRRPILNHTQRGESVDEPFL